MHENIKLRDFLRDLVKRHSFFTNMVLLFLVLTFFVQTLLDIKSSMVGVNRFLVGRGEGWRLFTEPVFHMGWAHVIQNVIWAWPLGILVDYVVGRRGLFFVILLSALSCSTLNSVFVIPPTTTVGFSGVVFGLLGAFFAQIQVGKFDSIPQKNKISWILGISYSTLLVTGFLNEATNNLGHIGGLLGGIAGGIILRNRLPTMRNFAYSTLIFLILFCLTATAYRLSGNLQKDNHMLEMIDEIEVTEEFLSRGLFHFVKNDIEPNFNDGYFPTEDTLIHIDQLQYQLTKVSLKFNSTNEYLEKHIQAMQDFFIYLNRRFKNADKIQEEEMYQEIRKVMLSRQILNSILSPRSQSILDRKLKSKVQSKFLVFQ